MILQNKKNISMHLFGVGGWQRQISSEKNICGTYQIHMIVSSVSKGGKNLITGS